MPLRNFFLEQQQQLLEFLSSEDQVVCLLSHADDIRKLVDKSLLALDEDESHAHILLYIDQAWQSEDGFFEDLLLRLQEQVEVYRTQLSSVGVKLPDPLANAAGKPLIRLVAAAEALLRCIPSENCALVFICACDDLEDVAAASRALLNFVGMVRSARLKLIVLDAFPKPRFASLVEQSPRVGVQKFHLAMDKVEQQVNKALASDQLVGLDRIRYLGMAGAFAAAHRRFDEAEAKQLEILKRVGEVNSPADEAMARYNLGNTYLNRQRYVEAETQFGRAAEICLAQKMNPLLAMVLTNLGITLHRQQRLNEAFQCLEISRRTFAALDNRPGVAYVLDCCANIHGLENQVEAAEKAWREAIACYDSITNPTMADVRKHGREDILVKLKAYMEHVGRKEQIRDLIGSEGTA